MFETTRDFFEDACNYRLEDPQMLNIVLVLGLNDPVVPLGQVIHDFHKLTVKQRNYVCCVLLERDADPDAWAQYWSGLESEMFE